MFQRHVTSCVRYVADRTLRCVAYFLRDRPTACDWRSSILLRSVTEVRKLACVTLSYGKKYATFFWPAFLRIRKPKKTLRTTVSCCTLDDLRLASENLDINIYDMTRGIARFLVVS